MTKPKSLNHKDGVIFFDGLCVLCNKSVSFLIKIDKKKVLKYSSLQGDYAKEVLDSEDIDSASSVIFLDDGVSYKKADAAIHILIKLGGVYKALGVTLNLLPTFFINWFYDLVAKNRYSIFGKKDSCPIPKEEEKELFIP